MENNNNNNNAAAAANRGRGRGRGGNATRGGNQTARGAPRAQGANAPLVATQLRQLERLQEPDEMAVLRRFSGSNGIGALRIRSEYSLTGLVSRQVGIMNADGSALEWITLEAAELQLNLKEAARQRATWEARRVPRLTELGVAQAAIPATFAACSEQQKTYLRMSQTEWSRFLAPRRAQAAAGNGQAPASQGPVAGNSEQVIQDGGNADQEETE